MNSANKKMFTVKSPNSLDRTKVVVFLLTSPFLHWLVDLGCYTLKKCMFLNKRKSKLKDDEDIPFQIIEKTNFFYYSFHMVVTIINFVFRPSIIYWTLLEKKVQYKLINQVFFLIKKF